MVEKIDENMLLLSSRFLKQKEYWMDKLSGDFTETDILFYHKKSPTSSVDGDRERVKILLPGNLSDSLIKLSKKSDLSLYIILLAGLKSLIYRYTNDEDIIVVSPLHRLKISEYTINSRLFLRDRMNAKMSFKELILDIRTSVLEAYANQDYPFDRLMEYLFSTQPLGSQEKSLSNIACSLGNIHDEKNIKELNIKTKLSLSLLKKEDEITGDIEYDANSYEKYYMERLSQHFVNLLENVVQNVEIKIFEIHVLSKEEKEQLLLNFNATGEGYPERKTIHQLFEEYVEKRGDHPAVIFNKKQLSYIEVNEKANRLARELKSKGIQRESIVGIIVERSMEMVIGELGILKAGGAFLPIDPEYPKERIEYILDDCNVEIVLIQSQLGEKKFFNRKNIEDIGVDIDSLSDIEDKNIEIKNINTSKDLAYVMHTSGSTGKPKGIMVSHQNVVRLVKSSNVVALTEETRILLTGAPVFDATTFELWGSLLNGGRLYFVGHEVLLDAHRLGEALESQKINTLWLSSPLFNQLAWQNSNIFAPLDYLIVGGDILSPKFINMVRNRHKRLKIVNGYGPTENTTFSTFFAVDRDFDRSIPLGRPIKNSTAYVVNRNYPLCLQPIGVLGELCVGGDGVARGYLNSPEMTSEKFIQNPFVEGDRLYKTGDLAQWLPDGILDFQGRLDHQIKIKGYRVELGEIESQLQKHELVKDAVVTIIKADRESSSPTVKVKSSGSNNSEDVNQENKYLCAYIALKVKDEDPVTPSVFEWREYLSGTLPDYMIPSHFVVLDEFALTANGKIDTKKLPDPGEAVLRSNGEYVAPRNAVELELIEICNRVLARSNISINDNFFEMGGDSIKAIQIASRMYRAGYKIDIADIFQYPTISELSHRAKKLEKTASQDVITGIIPLTPIQKSFFKRYRIATHHFNQSIMLYSKEELSERAIKAVFAKIQEHHDALRMTFERNPGNEKEEIIQINQGLGHPLWFEGYDFRNCENSVKMLESKVNEIQSSIDLEKGPLMKLGLFHLDDGDRLLIVLHHLVIDTVSWRILFEDIGNLYQQYENGDQMVLPLKTDSFKVWSEKLSEYANSEAFMEEKRYWRELESQVIPVIKKDFLEKENYNKDTETLTFQLSEEETSLLLTRVNNAFGTEINDILLTALGMGIKEVFGNSQLFIALEGHGREEIVKDVNITRTVGWFTSTYPVILNFSYEYERQLARQIIEVKETIRRVPNKGIGYGILKYLTAEEHKTEIEFKLEPQISFNYLGQFDVDLEKMSFRMADESSGMHGSPKERREYELNVTGIIMNKQLSLIIFYNTKQYKKETINRLLERYQALLCYIISYCSSREERELTPNDLTYKNLSIEELEQLKKQYVIDDIYSLTPLQEGMLFHALYQTDIHTDFVQISCLLHGELDLVLVEKSLNELFKRHDVLRTAFIHKGFKEPLQVVLKDRQVDFYSEDMRKIVGKQKKEAYIQEFQKKDRDNAFNLGKDVLMRVAVLQTDDDSYEFIWSFHHILMDGWCMGIIIKEFFDIYNSYLENRGHGLPNVKPYREYIEWLQKRDKKESKDYWKKYLESYDQPAGIPKSKVSNTNEKDYKNTRFSFILEKEIFDALKKLASVNHVTLNIIIQTIWGIILAMYNGKQDVVFGIVVSGRPSEINEVERMVGLFINTVPVRITYEGNLKFTQLLQSVQKKAMESERHHYYPLPEIQAESALKQNLLDHILDFHNLPMAEQIDGLINGNEKNEKGSPLELSSIEAFEQTNYDLNVVIFFNEQLHIDFEYNANVYEEDVLNTVARHIQTIIDQVLTNEEISIDQLTLLSEEERSKLIEELKDEKEIMAVDMDTGDINVKPENERKIEIDTEFNF
jgi:amino acid adenylation domain-containing protein/non-ribosomal peptide synthase protein (TIGR01720 family)